MKNAVGSMASTDRHPDARLHGGETMRCKRPSVKRPINYAVAADISPRHLKVPVHILVL